VVPLSGLDRIGRAGLPGAPSAGGALAESGPARVSYTVTDHGDWSHLVPEIAAGVAARLVGDRLGAWVDQTSTRRRGGGFYQSLSAWWASDLAVVEVSGTRSLAPAGDKRFRPDGPWVAHALVHTLEPVPVSAKSWSRRSASTGPAGSLGPSRLVHDALELLPEPLRRLTAGGPPARALLWDHGDRRSTEEVMSYRVLNGRAVVLAAWRGPARKEALEAETWHSRVVDTTVVESRTHELRLPTKLGASARREGSAGGRSLAEGVRKSLPWGPRSRA